MDVYPAAETFYIEYLERVMEFGELDEAAPRAISHRALLPHHLAPYSLPSPALRRYLCLLSPAAPTFKPVSTLAPALESPSLVGGLLCLAHIASTTTASSLYVIVCVMNVEDLADALGVEDFQRVVKFIQTVGL
ncbi:hypothetical protein V5O48_017094 [Marasmius crinis-equi]|uniref:Uncharacterized protein n=1 Tax=Marasmius crinis-equi TaxID=585013 RepID=A0ABR3EPW4_9AGAR